MTASTPPSREVSRVGPSSPAPLSGSTRAALVALLVAAAALRLFRLDHQSVWADEAFSIVIAERGVADMTARLVQDFVHPPLHYYLLHGVFSLFGVGSAAARLPSAIFGVLAVASIFFLGRRMFGARAGLIAAALLCVSQLGVMYSQEARPYAQALFLVVAAAHLFVVAAQERRAAAWWGFVAVAVLAAYTHYYAGLAMAVLYGAALAWRRATPIPLRWVFAGAAASALAYAPWLASGVVGRSETSRIDPGERPWFTADLSSIVRGLNDYNDGRFFGVEAATATWTYAVGGALFTSFALLALLHGTSRGRGGRWWSAAVAAVAVALYGVAAGGVEPWRWVLPPVFAALVLALPRVRASSSWVWRGAYSAAASATAFAAWDRVPVWAPFLAGLLAAVAWWRSEDDERAPTEPVVSGAGSAADGDREGRTRVTAPAPALSGRRGAILCAWLAFAPLVVIIGLHWFGVQYNVRYTLPCLPPYLLLVARGLSVLRPAWLRGGLMVLLLGYGGASLRANYFVPYKENYRDALRLVRERCAPGDCVAFGPWGRNYPHEWRIYRLDEGSPDLRLVDPETALRERGCRVVWLVTYHRVADAAGKSQRLRHRFDQAYRRASTDSFHWVVVDRYEARRR